MNTDLKLKSFNFKPLLAKMSKRYGRHIVFAAIIFVLLVYIFVVFRISGLSKAEPAPGQPQISAPLIPKSDQQVINRIQALGNNNVQLHALFKKARTNPFQE